MIDLQLTDLRDSLIPRADLREEDPDMLLNVLFRELRFLAAAHRRVDPPADRRLLTNLARITAVVRARVLDDEEVEEEDDVEEGMIFLSHREASAVWSDIAAINLMLGVDGWEESDDADGAELAEAIHDVGAKMLTNGVPQALGVRIWNQVLLLGDKLDRTLHGRTVNEMQQGLQARPLSMEELHSVLQAANEAASALALLRVENNRLRARNAKLKQQRLATRKYLGRIMKQVSP